jgi:hypothetical protein
MSQKSKQAEIMKQDENGDNVLNREYIRHIVKEQGGFDTPTLNNFLRLHFKGKTLRSTQTDVRLRKNLVHRRVH